VEWTEHAKPEIDYKKSGTGYLSVDLGEVVNCAIIDSVVLEIRFTRGVVRVDIRKEILMDCLEEE
jgi:hypothetical protein